SFQLKTNTIGVVHSTNAFLPLLKNSLAKKVASITSALEGLDVTVLGEGVCEPSYSISKTALNMVVAKYAAQYKVEGFTFLGTSPGLVQTAILLTESDSPKEFRMLWEMVANLKPDYSGPMSTEESDKMLLEVIDRWTVEQSGAFVSHFGNKQWL
ncbi:hypothetical protein K438DRAFT_1580026, partial [Mycena galopus ATCC 62051]